MGFKNFRLNVIIRIVFLSASILGFILLVLQTSFYATAIVVGVVILAQTASFVRYVEKTSSDLTRFLSSIRYADFSSTFTSAGRGRAFDELRLAFTEVMEAFRRTRSETEEQARYLETVVQHIGVGLISFQSSGEVGLINTAAKRLLRLNHLTNIRTLEPLSKELVETLLKMKSGDKALLKIERENETLQLVVNATEFRLREQHYTLVSIQNIRSELEEKEMDAWQNLIRVLTHEIMNSITPISSLASTVNDLLESPSSRNDYGIKEEIVGDIRGALQTIEKRSQGLLHFVDAYRNLTRIPRPNIKVFPIAGLFTSVEQLMKAQIVEKGIEFRTDAPSSLELAADPELIEQVLINLLQNASHAVKDQAGAKIVMSAGIDNRGRVFIEVSDNGPGIPKEIQERVFIPFFTTKKDGTGIGLSLSRQIMRLHGGTISVRSTPGIETVFTLRL